MATLQDAHIVGAPREKIEFVDGIRRKLLIITTDLPLHHTEQSDDDRDKLNAVFTKAFEFMKKDNSYIYDSVLFESIYESKSTDTEQPGAVV